MPKRYIPVGKLAKPIGRKGRFKVNILSKGLKTLEGVSSVYLRHRDGRLEEYGISEISLKRDSASMKVQGIDSPEEVLALKNAQVCIDLDDLGGTGEGEYYHHELLGCEVFDLDEKYMGTIDSIFETGAGDIWCVKKDEKETMVPAVANIVRQVDVKKKKVKIDPPKGLFDD